jgi:hypothetical protein
MTTQTKNNRGGAKAKYPFDALEIGEDFVIENPKVPRDYMRTYACRRARQLGKRFFVYQLSTGAIYVVRIA